jgi:hypothetical protein
VDLLLLAPVPAEQIERERQRDRRRLVPGQQEDQGLVADLLRVHRRAGVRVAGAQ